MSRRCNDISKTAKDHVFRPHISSIPIEGTKEMQLGTCFEVIRHSSPENFVPTHPTQPATPTSPRKTSFCAKETDFPRSGFLKIVSWPACLVEERRP